MHKVISLSIAKPLLITVKSSYAILYRDRLKERTDENNSRRKWMQYSDSDVKASVDRELYSYKKVVEDLELLCTITGDIQLTVDEYRLLDQLQKRTY